MLLKQYFKKANYFYKLNKVNKISRFYSEKRPTTLAGQLQAKIKATGPLTVADYMKEVLINPASGYYTQQDSTIGASGDFVTSPELCQLFGEMIGVWILNEWHKVGSPKPMQLVELGPGKGTLMDDILKVMKHLNELENVSVHLVELSQKLQDQQAKKICSEITVSQGGENLYFARGITHYDCNIYWHHNINQVPRDAFTCVIAHEFFDALPVHKLQKTSDGWREVLIDIDSEKENAFRYIISRSPTPASQIYSTQYAKSESKDHIEICLEGGALLQELSKRFEEDGGFFLMADYGHDGTKSDTFRGFKKHELHDPLINPGSADLTADVDFNFLKNCVKNSSLTFGPITQRDFLINMGIDYRLQVLMQNKNLSEASKEKLKSSVDKLINPNEMGERFKFFAIFPNVLEEHLKRFPVVGFHQPISN